MRLSPDSLLAHEPFVRAVVRDLLRDEHRVQDVLQETWIRALHQGPSEGGSLKGWLAKVARRLALDQRRGTARRDRREREAARGEALESVDSLSARLEAQREVVDAVLALEEPYKSVVLLAYYEQLAPHAIGERLGRSPATVRSQLSRAHEILRRRLDQHHGGDRSAWAGILLPWAVATKSKAGLAVAAGIGIALIGTGALLLPRVLGNHGSQAGAPNQVALERTTESAPDVQPLSVAALPESPGARAVVEGTPPATESQKPDLSKLTADELRDLAVQAMRTLEKKLLTPEARFFESQSALLALPDTGLAKMIMRTHEGFPYERLILPRCGGGYFSFETKSHSYDREPDIGYQQGQLESGFYGAMVGIVLEIGDLDLARLDRSRQPAWESLFALPETDDIPGARKMQEWVRDQHLGSAAAKSGMTYLVRTWSPGEHDHLVGVRVLGVDAESVTIAWRILQRFPHADPKRPAHEPPTYNDVPAPPAWMEVLDARQLVDFIHEVRRKSEPLLLGIPDALQLANAWRTNGNAPAGFFRLLPRDRYAPAVEAPWGATSYSFETLKHTDRNAQIERTGEMLRAEFLVDLARLDAAEYLGVLNGECPARLAGGAKEAWSFLWTTPSVYTGGGGTSNRGMSRESEQRFRELWTSPNRATQGHNYLLRAIDPDADTDRLVLLTVLETSDYGTTLCWRELKRFDR